MEIEVLQDRLAKALNTVSRVAASTKAGLPILSNVLLRAEENQLTLTATNMEMAIVQYVNAKAKKNGIITVPAKLLAEFVSNLPKDNVVISTKDDKLTVSAGKYKSTINGILADDFPELPKIDEKEAVIFKISVDIFKEAVNEVIIASSNDTTRPALTGVYFNTFDGSLYIAATDGYRLADRKFVDEVKSEIKAIVPTNALQEVIRSISDNMDEIEVLINDSQIRFRMGEIEITSKLIDASFPDYRQLIPKDCSNIIELDKAELIRMTKVAALFARESGGSIVCEAKKEEGSFSVSAVASELGENSSAMEAVVSEDGKVVLNSRYLLDALNSTIEGKITFGLSGKLAPVIIKNAKNNDYTHIIMPLKS
jgi:DNA polymerase-3 subunit beta